MRVLMTILINLLLNTLSIPTIVNAESSVNHPSGLMIGQYQSIQRKGIFFKRHSVPFLLGAGLSSAIAYPPLRFPLTLKNTSLEKKLRTLSPNKPVVIHYQQPINHWRGWDILGRHPRTVITDISKPKRINASNGHQHPWSALNETGELNTMKASGFLLRLYRFGTLDQLCSVSVHLGGNNKLSTELQQTTLTGFDAEGHRIADTTEQLMNNAQANIGHFNIASQTGCQFAEDALKAGAMIEIEFSERYFKLFKTSSMTIHAIRRLNQGLFSLPSVESENLFLLKGQ